MEVTERTRIRNHPERAAPDEAADILPAGVVALLGIVENGQPLVIRLAYHYDQSQPDLMYLHGSVSSGALATLAAGAPVCVTVTLVDGLVYSREAMSHSMNYRSVVLLGKGRAITDQSGKFKLFEQMVRRYFPDRALDRDYNPPPDGELDATALVEVKTEEWNATARRGGPTGPDGDNPDALGTAGVIVLREV